MVVQESIGLFFTVTFRNFFGVSLFGETNEIFNLYRYELLDFIGMLSVQGAEYYGAYFVQLVQIQPDWLLISSARCL